MSGETAERCGDKTVKDHSVVGCPHPARYRVTHVFAAVTSDQYVCGRHVGWFRRNGNYEITALA